MTLKKVTRVQFSVAGLKTWDEMFAICKKVEEVLDKEGLESYYGETCFLTGPSREIGYWGWTNKEEEITKILTDSQVKEFYINLDEEEEEE